MLPCPSTTFLRSPAWKNGPHSRTPKTPQKQGFNTMVIWGKTSVSLQQHGERAKHQAEIQEAEHNLILPEVKWIISINPGQTVDWLCWYFLEEKWLFCTYSKSKGHTLFIFATLQEEFVLLSQSQGPSLKFLNQGERFMQYQRLTGE